MNGGLGVLLLSAAILRETSLFWRNAGGYPVWLRDVIYILFYPGLFAYFIGLAWLSWMSVRLLSAGFRFGGERISRLKGVARGRDWRFDGAMGWRDERGMARRHRAGDGLRAAFRG